MMLAKLDEGMAPSRLWAELRGRLEGLAAYRLIRESYAGKVARRSGVAYLNHVHEGVYVLVRTTGWRERVVGAYCVHPIFQSDRWLAQVLEGGIDVSGLRREEVVLAMEYRRVANAYVSTMRPRGVEGIALSPVEEVNAMLVADKVQNKKDFMRHVYKRVGRGSYERASERYVAYFDSWLERLGVSAEMYRVLERELRCIERASASEACLRPPVASDGE
jgi:hypothetical protein